MIQKIVIKRCLSHGNAITINLKSLPSDVDTHRIQSTATDHAHIKIPCYYISKM